MKAILLSLLLLLPISGNTEVVRNLKNDIQFKQILVERVYKIYSKCMVTAYTSKRVEEAHLYFKKKGVDLPQYETRRYVFTFCMSGNYDIRLNKVTKHILNMKKEI